MKKDAEPKFDITQRLDHIAQRRLVRTARLLLSECGNLPRELVKPVQKLLIDRAHSQLGPVDELARERVQFLVGQFRREITPGRGQFALQDFRQGPAAQAGGMLVGAAGGKSSATRAQSSAR